MYNAQYTRGGEGGHTHDLTGSGEGKNKVYLKPLDRLDSKMNIYAWTDIYFGRVTERVSIVLVLRPIEKPRRLYGRT